MDAPPWRGLDEPSFMPRIRREFARRLPERIRRGRSALDALLAAGSAAEEPMGELFSTVHDLSGTAETVGAAAMAEPVRRIAGRIRRWASDPRSPAPGELNELAADWRAVEAQADRFLGWMDSEPGGPP
jgi:hypothetical protein